MYNVACDPEVFFEDCTYGSPVSAVGLIGGSKKRPLKNDWGTLQEDNVAAEFTIDPTTDVEKFSKDISNQLMALDGIASKQELYVSRSSSLIFPDAQLKDKAARVAGCDPDYNAWTGEENPIVSLRDTKLRSAGGHIHIDLPMQFLNAEGKAMAARAADLVIGQYESSVFDVYRRSLYGKAGAYRPKSYGIEYRTPGNWWIFDITARRQMFKLAQVLTSDIEKWADLAAKHQKAVMAALNFGDVDARNKLRRVYSKEA